MVEFIAEISSNHNRDLTRCRQLIETAARIGCVGAKFQLFRVDKLFALEILTRSQQHRDRKQWELPLEFIPELAAMCHDNGILFGCSPFYLEAVDELYPYVDFYKVASYELNWHTLLKQINDTGQPTVLSTGMAVLGEVVRARNILTTVRPTILHCVSAYPCPVAEANLSAITALHLATGCPVGWSDHTVSPAVLYRAIHKFDARVIEFHLDLEDRQGYEAAAHCWTPDRIGEVIANVNDGLRADGYGTKIPTRSELPDRAWRRDPVDGLRPMGEAR